MPRRPRPPIKPLDNIDCWTCIDSFYFRTILQLDDPQSYINAQREREPQDLVGRVRRAGGLKP